jgi:hypothetical protein
MKNFFSEMLKCKRLIYENRDRLSADVFLKVKSFVEGGSYSSCKKASDIAKMTLQGFNPQAIAEHFELSYETIRTEKRNISNELWGIFPKDFFEKLADYKSNKDYIDDCIFSLENVCLSSKDLLLMGISNDILSKNTLPLEDYSIEDLQDELFFLLRYSKAFYENDLLTVDLNKLAYLIGVIDGKEGNSSIRAEVLKSLKV